MTKKKPRYESRVFDGRIIHSTEIERIHKEVIDFKHIEAIGAHSLRPEKRCPFSVVNFRSPVAERSCGAG
jgi:hypothetical protein